MDHHSAAGPVVAGAVRVQEDNEAGLQVVVEERLPAVEAHLGRKLIGGASQIQAVRLLDGHCERLLIGTYTLFVMPVNDHIALDWD